MLNNTSNYDDNLSIWLSVDPLSDMYPSTSPYMYCMGNPIMLVDPTGMNDTDYTLNKKTGEVKMVGEENNKPDRILKTNRRGKVKYDNNGNAKVAIDKIDKGILKDGQNFKTKDNFFKVGGEGQPSEAGVERFALDLSEYVGREIKGLYFSKNDSKHTDGMTIGYYENNLFDKSFGNGSSAAYSSEAGYRPNNVTATFHTHPRTKGNYLIRIKASSADNKAKNTNLESNPNMKFYILTRPYNSTTNNRKIPY